MISFLRSITPVSAGSDYNFTESDSIPTGEEVSSNLPEHMTRITEMCLSFINERGQEQLEHDSTVNHNNNDAVVPVGYGV
jgi:hypothetical protein